MSDFKTIQNKLEAFIRRYYTNELLKGTILFFAIGLLYFLVTLFIEHMLWLNTTARALLFWLFILVELALLVTFIFMPLAKLFKLQKGINYEDASKIIGLYFPEVSDKLLNVLQLHQNPSQSELLLASIRQKSLQLNPIPFKLAVNFKKNVSYLKYAAIPVLMLLIPFLLGKSNWFQDSFERVVHYKTAYEQPAPFRFFVVNETLKAVENKDFKVLVKVAGNLIPENAEIVYHGETYFLQQTGLGEFEYVFSQLKEPLTFQLTANNITSKTYTINVIEVPSLLSFEMVIDYPSYTKKVDEILKGTGNAMVPEGTKITWKLKTKATDNVHLFANDTTSFNSDKSGVFESSKKVYNHFNYAISTSNKNLKDYENLAFKIAVVKDQYPEINLKGVTDSLDLQTLYFYGQVTDDYGLSKLQLVYYPTENESNIKYETIPISNSNISEFISTFPNNLAVQDGVSYSLYFQVFDNDEVNNKKSVKSPVFSYRKRTLDEDAQKNLNEQGESIKELNKSLKKFDAQEKQLQELSNTQKEKADLNFNDKKKLDTFLERQKQQDELMKNFNKKLQDNIEKFEVPKDENAFKEDLKERLKQNEAQLIKDEKLLKEIEKLQEKINKEELLDKLDDLAKQNKNKKRSLEQLLELTKRFYVQQKLDKLKNDLSKLAEEQDKLATKKEAENTKENQEELNDAFDTFKKQLDDLKKEGNTLKKPIDVPQDKLQENEIKKDQQEASDALEKNKEAEAPKASTPETKKPEHIKNAQKSQKKAAQKMKQLSEQMQGAMQSMEGEQMQEDVEMLRQILDNLVLFSFEEEALMDAFSTIEENHPNYPKYLKKQNSLKAHFEHIDDSIFALSLRQPKLSEQVNKDITDVYYNIDKALELFADTQILQGIAKQQFSITATNNLANLLSDILDNMQEELNMSMGKGTSSDMQIPDMIMTQEQLNKMMEEGMKESESGKPKENEKGNKPSENEPKGSQSKQGKGTDKQNKETNEPGNLDYLNGLLYEIYQQQQQLRNALADKLAKQGQSTLENNLLKNMEDVELDLLNNGFTNQTLNKMLELKHQLLKLENAELEQGEDPKRESKTNTNLFNNSSKNLMNTIKQYFNTTEILNKQSLPLQPIYKKKVQVYFKKDND